MAAFTMFIIGCRSKIPVEQTIAYHLADSLWSTLRSECKLHLQVIASSAIFEDRSMQLVLTEPPPHVTKSQVKSTLKGFHFLMKEQKNNIGYDGWTKDLLISFSDVDRSDSADLMKQLSNYLFYTDYKAYVVPLPFTFHVDPYLPDIDHQIQASELNKWFIKDTEEFIDLSDSTKTLTLPDLLNGSQTGIIYSKRPGFVIWLLKFQDDISSQQETIRKFCLDTDLLLGCIKGHYGQLAIIGRERIADIYQLPPLRTETVQLLASCNKEQISQSYERTDLFAGKMDGGKDWAPIYLSDELINTEYGSLLNITDQMLKSWSMSGKVEYEKFDYSVPVAYPFYPDAMSEMNTSQLLFNWNTKGAGYTVSEGDNELFCLNRTGALPITYKPENREGMGNSDNLDRIEKHAYAYYARLNNKDLVRVAEYASLYQLFARYKITADHRPTPTEAPPSSDNTASYSDSTVAPVADTTPYMASEHPLSRHFDTLIARLQNMDDQRKAEIAQQSLEDDLNSSNSKVRDYALDHPMLDKLQTFLDLDKLTSIVNPDSLTDIYTFKDYILNPRKHESDLIDPYTWRKATLFTSTMFKCRLLKYIVPDFTIRDYRDAYAKAHSDAGSAWIKTPSLVISWSTKDSAIMQGGHNLGARTTKFEVSSSVRKGELQVVEEADGVKKVLINESDVASINTDVLRSIELSPNAEPYIHISSDNYIPRERNAVIPSVQRPERGMHTGFVYIREHENGFTIGNKTVQRCDQLVEELTKLAGSDSYEKLEVHFENISSNRAKAIIKSSEIKYEAHPEWRTAHILDDPEFFKIKGSEYDFQQAKIISGLSDDVVIEIPSAVKDNARARVTLKNVAYNIRDKVMRVINNIFGRMRPETDFYAELVQELKSFNISPQMIRLEKDDCIICFKPGCTDPAHRYDC